MDYKAKDAKGRPKYIYGKIMNVEQAGGDIRCAARNVEWDGKTPESMVKHYIYPDGYKGWIPRSVVGAINHTTYRGLPDKQELANLDKGEAIRRTENRRYVFVELAPAEVEGDSLGDVAEEIIAGKEKQVAVGRKAVEKFK